MGQPKKIQVDTLIKHLENISVEQKQEVIEKLQLSIAGSKQKEIEELEQKLAQLKGSMPDMNKVTSAVPLTVVHKQEDAGSGEGLPLGEQQEEEQLVDLAEASMAEDDARELQATDL